MVAIAQNCRWQRLRTVDGHDREVAFRIGQHGRGAKDSAIGQLDGDLFVLRLADDNWTALSRAVHWLMFWNHGHEGCGPRQGHQVSRAEMIFVGRQFYRASGVEIEKIRDAWAKFSRRTSL